MQLLVHRCTCHHTFAFNIIPMPGIYTNSSRASHLRDLSDAKILFRSHVPDSTVHLVPGPVLRDPEAQILSSFFGARVPRNPKSD